MINKKLPLFHPTEEEKVVPPPPPPPPPVNMIPENATKPINQKEIDEHYEKYHRKYRRW